MKALLLTADDGISADVWLLHAIACKRLGRPIFAITEVSNVWDAIGTGDGLPGYPLKLTEYAGFTNRKVKREDAADLMAELSQLTQNTVVLWNMSIFEEAAKDPQWVEVLKFCSESVLDMLFVHYYSTAWAYGVADPESLMVNSIGWDYVAGSRIWTQSNRDLIFAMFPYLVPVLESQPEPKIPNNGVCWQVASVSSRSLNLRAPYREITKRPEVLATLAWAKDTALKKMWFQKIFA